jgi:hypothetical protein
VWNVDVNVDCAGRQYTAFDRGVQDCIPVANSLFLSVAIGFTSFYCKLFFSYGEIHKKKTGARTVYGVVAQLHWSCFDLFADNREAQYARQDAF